MADEGQLTAGAAADDAAVPLISVVITVYNGERFIAATIDSILAQTEPRFELLIVDDGSTDNTAEIADDFARLDARIRVLRCAHQGISTSNNFALQQVRGAFFAKIDADDIAPPRRFEWQLAHFAAHPDTVVVGGGMVLLLPDGSRGRTVWGPAHAVRGPKGRGAWVPHPAATIRTSALRAIGGYRSAFVYAQDADLWERLIEIGDIDNLSEIVLHYRQHQGQVSNVFNQLQELEGSVALILGQCRRDIGHEPDWDSNEPLNPAIAAALAAKAPPLTAAMLNVALAQYYRRGGDFMQAVQHITNAARGYAPAIRRGRAASILVRLIIQAPKGRHFGTMFKLLALSPISLARGSAAIILEHFYGLRRRLQSALARRRAVSTRL